ncbi:hypothetical protein [Pseudomonas sp. B11(2017)]|uniref:hypothetical protein n=1 Tax=Pseudomonas sp. B11(2017) TaxID=1981748 RepID=UPI000A1FDD87|nr:hypothetical protein [Pseudomonas sp. B11(2017)]
MNNSMKASISYYEETFVGQDDFEIRRVGNRYVVQASQALPNGEKHSIAFWVPVDTPGDGSSVTLSLVPDPMQLGQARGEYIRYSSGNGLVLASRSGTLTLKLDMQTQRMEGDFQFEARLGDTTVHISAGSFDITGITGGVVDTTGSGTFTASSEWGDFRADQLSVQLTPEGSTLRVWEVIGRMTVEDGVPPKKAQIGVFFKDDTNLGTHDLRNNPNVWIHYSRPYEGAFFAEAGTLTLTALPVTGHTKGTFAADFLENGKSVKVTGQFDILSAVGKNHRHHR